MSIPRDLWVEIVGTGRSQRINTAYNDGPERLAATVSESLGIPIHHYVEVDFQGFKNIIDEIGGIEICVDLAARDANSGLEIQPGCNILDGTMALAYARSRHYEEWDGTDWVEDPRADLGRIERQQFFIRSAVNYTLAQIGSSPFSSGDTVQAVAASVRIDPRLDPIKAARGVAQGRRAWSAHVRAAGRGRHGRRRRGAASRRRRRPVARLLPRRGPGAGRVRDHRTGDDRGHSRCVTGDAAR